MSENGSNRGKGYFRLLPSASFLASYCKIYAFWKDIVYAVREKGVLGTMVGDVFLVGSRVRVTSYSPFRGLKGTIRTVDTIAPGHEDEELFCFYKITLEEAHIREPIWFEYDEVELVASPSLVSRGVASL